MGTIWIHLDVSQQEQQLRYCHLCLLPHWSWVCLIYILHRYRFTFLTTCLDPALDTPTLETATLETLTPETLTLETPTPETATLTLLPPPLLPPPTATLTLPPLPLPPLPTALVWRISSNPRVAKDSTPSRTKPPSSTSKLSICRFKINAKLVYLHTFYIYIYSIIFLAKCCYCIKCNSAMNDNLLQ